MRVLAVALVGSALASACGSAPEDRALAEERIAQRTAEIVLARLQAERDAPPERGGASAGQGAAPGADIGAIVGDALRIRVPTDGAPARGAREPLVTIVVFSDFQCPFCNRARPTIDRILRERPDTVRFVFRNHPLPFHPDAHVAAQAAHEAFVQRGEAAFWRAHDLFFDNQRALDRASLETYARTLGLDLVRFNGALDAQTHAPKIDADTALSARVGATGTPSFFLNGRELEGAQPYDAFDRIIEEEIAAPESGRRAFSSGIASSRARRRTRSSGTRSTPSSARPDARSRRNRALDPTGVGLVYS
jgi:protein-disulfide isomerase